MPRRSSRSFSGPKWITPGVEIHANTMRTLLERRYLCPSPHWLLALALLVAAAVTVLITTSLAAGRAVTLVLIEIAAILAVTHLLFEGGLILSTSEILLATSICLVASVVYRFSTAEKRGKLFHRAVALFVGKQLASSLDETEAIALSGKRLDVTILFTDIRGFTAFTEQVCDEQGPEVVVQLLNEYMAMMVRDHRELPRPREQVHRRRDSGRVFRRGRRRHARRSRAARGSLRHPDGHGSEHVFRPARASTPER